MEKKEGRARCFGVKLKGLLTEAVELRERYREGHQEQYQEKTEKLKQEITDH